VKELTKERDKVIAHIRTAEQVSKTSEDYSKYLRLLHHLNGVCEHYGIPPKGTLTK
jgi:hypothetical protein